MTKDLLLINQMKEGDAAALSALYDKYAPALLGVIFRICNNKALAEDILQESFVKIWQQSSSYDPQKGKFYTWAYRICKNLTLNELRKNKNLIQSYDLSVYESSDEVQAENVDPLKLNGAINALEPRHKQAIELVYFRGHTHAEAHKVMNVPLGTFKSYIAQALKKLKTTYTLVLLICIQLLERVL